jgi:polysaccharide biosynthesis/export protein
VAALIKRDIGIIKTVLMLGIVLFMAGCAVPGTYLSSSGMNAQTDINGKWQHPHIIPVSAQLLQHTSSRSHRKVFRSPPEYRVGAFDVLSIIVWGHPELSPAGDVAEPSISVSQTSTIVATTAPVQAQQKNMNGFYVDAKGYIYFPYAGEMKVVGLTVEQVRRRLAKRLVKYFRDPQVSVRVQTFRSRQVFMIGELNKQGILPLTDRPLSLFDAINRSGGVRLMSANAGRIYVIRQSADGVPLVYWLHAKSPQALLLAEHFYLRPNDIVYVSPVGVVSWNRIVSQIMPTVQTIWYTYTITKHT